MAKHAKHSKENLDKSIDEIKTMDLNIPDIEEDAPKHSSLENKDHPYEFELSEEVIELEFDEESVSYYIVDDQNREIGVCLIEDGKEVEYMYEADLKGAAKDTYENLKDVKSNLEEFRNDAADIAKELRETVDSIQDKVDEVKNSFRIFPKKKK